MEKKCTRCKKPLPLSKFYKNKNGKYGVTSECISCRKIWRHKYHLKNKNKENKINKNWRKNNLVKDRELKRNYTLTAAGIWYMIRCRAKKRSIPFNISKDDFIKWHTETPDVCAYCKTSWRTLKKIKDQKNNRVQRLTIDRINNKKGYELGNICKACARCNEMKGNFFSAEQMKKIGILIQQVWKQGEENYE